MLAAMVRRSYRIKNFFDQAQSKTSKCRTLTLDVRTRWNSTFKMIDSFLGLKEVVSKFYDERESLGLSSKQSKKLDYLELTSNDWLLLKILTQLFKPFDLATKLLSAQRYPTIGLCLFVLHHIKLFLEDTDTDNEYLRQLKKFLLISMMHYIDNEVEQMGILRVSSFSLKKTCFHFKFF